MIAKQGLDAANLFLLDSERSVYICKFKGWLTDLNEDRR